MTARDKQICIRTDRATGASAPCPMQGVSWASTLQRIAQAEGKQGTVEEYRAITSRLLGGETIATAGYLYAAVTAREI